MKYIVVAVGCFAASVSMATAQTAPTAQTQPMDQSAPAGQNMPASQSAPMSSSTNPPAIAKTSGDSATTAAPLAGKNSFTEAQARDRLEKHGYTQVSALTKDNQSIWRGTAMKDSKSVPVAVDYLGNIVSN